MNFAHVHLMLNHVPVLGIAFGFGLGVAAKFRKSDELLRASLVVFVLTAIAALAVFLTGEPAEHFIEHMPGIAEAAIEEHEEMALISLIASGIAGGLALLGLLFFRRPKTIPAWLINICLIVSLITFGLMAQTANLGGQIRHEEIRSSVQ